MTSAHRAPKFTSNNWCSVEPLRKRQQPAKFTGECVMVKRFSRIARLYTVFGCFFIRNFGVKSPEKEPRVIWRSAYSVYSVACFTLMLTLETWAVYARFSHLDFTTMFTEAMLSTVHMCIVLKLVVNLMCLTAGSTRLLEFVHKATLFEGSAIIPYQIRPAPTTCTWFRTLRRLGVVITTLATLGGSLILVVQVFLEASKHSWTSEVAKIVLRMVSQAAFGIYDTSMYIVLSTVSEVLVYYVRSQGMTLLKCEQRVREARIDWQSAALVVENIRKNLCSVRELKNCISGIWAAGILAFSLCTLWVQCTTLYCLFIGHGNHLDLWLGLAYGAHCALVLLDLAVLSHDLKTEAENIRNLTTRAAMLRSEEAYTQQMAGFVITYTVILVQTSDGLSFRLSGASGNATP